MKSATRIASVAFTLALALGLAGTSALRAQDAATASSSVVPRLIKFSGVITSQGTQNRTSNSASAGVLTATFSLYELQESGAPLWSESQKVQLDEQGRYVVLLGATSPEGLPLDLFTTGKALWVGVQPQLAGQAEQPRVLLVAVPYSLKSSDADTLGGLPASAYALTGSATLLAPAGTAALSSASTTAAHPAEAGQAGAAAGSASSPQPMAACTAVTSDGTATANTVAKFTAACKVENSLIRDNGTGVAVGGTSAPGALLDVQYTSTATSGTLLGQRVLTTLNPAATSSATNIGAFSYALTAAGNTQNFTDSLVATKPQVDHYGTGTLAAGYGMRGYVTNRAAGTVTTAFGVYTDLKNYSTGKITNGYGVYVDAPANSGGGTFSNYTGLYIASPTAVTGAYGLYSAGGKNYFGGNVGIGTTTPAANLEVNGTAKFDGLVTFKSGQTFPGTGTVSSVASGSGLTGGPITTTGTLSIATAGVTDAMLANPYSGTGACAAGSFVTKLTRNATPICAAGNLGTVSSVASGAGLTGGPITSTGTLSIASAGVTDAMLANPYSGTGACAAGQVVATLTRNAAPTCVTASTGTLTSITAGTGLSGGTITTSGTINNTGILGVGVSPGITTTGGQIPTLGIDATVVPELAISNTFTTSQFVNGYLDAYGVGDGVALYGFNTSTDSNNPTLYLENDDLTSAGDLVFSAVGANYGGQCTIDVSGNLFCTGTLGLAINNRADNRQVGLYTVQSSENWIEDFGSGALVNGVASINIEPQFAQTVTTDASYHVFLTPNGDCEGLYVSQKGAASFEVHELKDGKSNVQFDYRIVAHRKGFEAARLPDLTGKFQKKVQPPARVKAALASQH